MNCMNCMMSARSLCLLLNTSASRVGYNQLCGVGGGESDGWMDGGMNTRLAE